jgi:sensor domain CHASE-containing protein
MSKALTDLPLQHKVSLTLVSVFAAFAVLSYGILTTVIAPAFEELDLATARTNLVRAERAIHSEIENVEAITADWGPWDDIHDYARGTNPGFEKSNLNRPTLMNLGLDVMAVYATDSRLLWSQLLVEGKQQELQLLGIFDPQDRAARSLTSHATPQGKTVGIVETSLGPMLISSRPILRSDETGPIAGAIIMGQFLNEPRLSELRQRTEVNFKWHAFDTFRHEHAIDSTHLDANNASISSYKVLSDIFGEPLLVLDATTPRKISALGAKTVNAAMMFLIITGLFVMIAIWYLLRNTILRPIKRLADHMKKIRETGDLSHRLAFSGHDEIGGLAEEFGNLTSDVHEARKALLFQSFKAGKADTAAEVLHNIRNAMTPMINGIERLGKYFRVADDLRVHEATQQLADPDCPSERAAKFLQYVDASFDHVRSSNAEALEEMKVVSSQARQVEAILSDQERFSKAPPVSENIVIEEVVGEAAHVLPKDSKLDLSVDLDGGLTRFRVCAHRVGLLQVLGNLILNAYESIQRASRAKGQISLFASETVVDNKAMVKLTVRDNGTGFDDGMGQRLFQRGYTSKSKGSTTGLGLHWCANAVASMGGRISAESRGSGQGAEFHVLLPAAQGGRA